MRAVIRSGSGKPCPIYYPGIAQYRVCGPDGKPMQGAVVDDNTLLIPTQKGCTYTISK